ncbi:UPF0280 family protein [soil metagenome]
MIPPVAARLPGGTRLHLQHGPIDLIIEVIGPPAAVAAAETAAIARFETVLDELVAQLPFLRSPLADHRSTTGPGPVGSIAQRMVTAATPFTGSFRTPMIAVAGSVADEVCAVIAAVPGVRRAYVNNGGDVALHLTPDQALTVGLVPACDTGRPQARLRVTFDSPVRGLATSGRGGRSLSLGIADAVTVVATCTAVADAAATLIANRVDLPGHPGVTRTPATDVDADSDLGSRLVTVEVGALTDADVQQALDRGSAAAQQWQVAVPDVLGVVLDLRGRRRLVGAAVAGVRDVAQGDRRVA